MRGLCHFVILICEVEQFHNVHDPLLPPMPPLPLPAPVPLLAPVPVLAPKPLLAAFPPHCTLEAPK